ncbi:MAG: pyrroline-5-carboxylate reductase [Acidiferrobacterales bacterium]|nr:pyrroline-5-carboxylate reductase [Acidiferrobacterales bacterium]
MPYPYGAPNHYNENMNLSNETSAESRIAFIGGGNMATSIIGGLLHSGMSADQITASDPAENRRQILSTEHGIDCYSDNLAAAANADIVVIAVKPQMMEVVLTDLSSLLQERAPLIVSIAAGIRIKDALRWIGAPLPFIRVMPNTPALVNLGASGLYANHLADQSHREQAESLMSSVSKVVWLEREELIDTVTGVSGSGPAYFFRLMELMIEEAEESGLSAEAARILVIQTALGAASLVSESSYSAGELRRQVTSPNGTTQAALEYMEEQNISGTIRGAVKAAVDRSVALSEQLGGE